MKAKFISMCAVAICLGTLVACGSSGNQSAVPATTGGTDSSGGSPVVTNAALGIYAVPAEHAGTFSKALKFNRYTKVDAPNGKAIHIFAQDQITDNQIVRARSILEHYLTNYPDSAFGTDKSAVANKMADNKATLMLLNGVDDGTNSAAELNGQPLYYGEMQVEGHDWYINQNYQHRDASFEEILHLVHDYGIGVDQNSQFIGALPVFQDNIRAAQVNALSANLWGIGAQDWINELTNENSLSQEYLAAVIDVYYGLWGASNEANGMNGLYVAKVRDDIASRDAQGAALLDKQFFHPYLTYNARIDESFSGDFSLRFNAQLAYTHHARYLKDVTLTGSNDSGVVVNELNNHITGNTGNNKVVFSGASGEYQIDRQTDQVVVTDLQDNRDGVNTLRGIEVLQFTDASVSLTD